MYNITRRRAIASGAALSSTACASRPQLTPFTAVSNVSHSVFSHGVASGDPQSDSIVIWTRISIPNLSSGESATVIWETAADEAFSDMRGKGEVVTGASRDWTVKKTINDLTPGTIYYYRFRIGDTYSPVGRMRTLPAGSIESARFAVVSCSNYPFGYFNVYDQIARRNDFDAVIHLGDYIYEYSRQGYGGETGAALGREHEPAHEVVSLDDYRRRHAQYKSDPASQAMHAAHPIIPIWDDHETSNNSWKNGAENHQPETEGDWNARRRAALQAYYEWMPVREASHTPEAFFRAYSYGDLLTLCALETRLMARAKQFEYSDIVRTLKTPEDVDRFKRDILWDETREMLGAAQLDYFDQTFRRSKAANQPWRLIANQIIMAKTITPDLTPHVSEQDIAALQAEWSQGRAFIETSKLGLPVNLDAWDGYPAARERFYEMVRETAQDGMIVITGDTHSWWANDLKDKNGEQRGIEIGVHSVTSPSPYRKSFLGGKGAEYALLTNRDNKDIRYLSGEDHGYIDLHIARDTATARFLAIDTVESLTYNAFEKASFEIKRENGIAKFSKAKGLGFKERFLF